MWSIPGSVRSPGEGNGNPLQYSCLENPMGRGAWRLPSIVSMDMTEALSMQARYNLFFLRLQNVSITSWDPSGISRLQPSACFVQLTSSKLFPHFFKNQKNNISWYEIQASASINEAECSHTQSFTYCLGCFLMSMAKLWQRPYNLPKPKIFVIWPIIEKKCANFYPIA